VSSSTLARNFDIPVATVKKTYTNYANGRSKIFLVP
jgi:hypothetical protein